MIRREFYALVISVLIISTSFSMGQLEFSSNESLKESSYLPSFDQKQSNNEIRAFDSITQQTDKGSWYRLFIDSNESYISNELYKVKITFQVLSFGNQIDRFHQIDVNISYKCELGNIEFPYQRLNDIDSEMESSSFTFDVLLDSSQFAENSQHEISLEFFCGVKFKEGYIPWTDPTTEEDFLVGTITFKKILQESNLINKQLQNIYTDSGSIMSIFVKTNTLWKVENYHTIIFTIHAKKLGEDINRFHNIKLQFFFKDSTNSFETNEFGTFEVGLGENYTAKINIRIPTSRFEDLQSSNELEVDLLYKISFKEGLCFDWTEFWEPWIDPEYSYDYQKMCDISLKNNPLEYPSGKLKEHEINIFEYLELSTKPSKSFILNTDDLFLNFTIYVNFEITYDVTHELTINTYYNEDEQSPFYYQELRENDIDVTVGVFATMGIRVDWENKETHDSDSVEIPEIYFPSLEDIDKDGFYIEIKGKKIYFWDNPVTENYEDYNTFGEISELFGGINIIPLQINILEYISKVQPELIIPDWLMTLNFRFSLNIHPYLYQLLNFDYSLQDSYLYVENSEFLGYADLDTTDNIEINKHTKLELKPEFDDKKLKAIPIIHTKAFSEIVGLIDISLEIFGLTVFAFPIVNLFSGYLEDTNLESYPMNSFYLRKSEIPLENWLPTVIVTSFLIAIVVIVITINKKGLPRFRIR